MKIKSFLLAGVFIVLSLFFAAPMNAKAANFTIDKYEVNMKVTKDNTYQIKEHIEVNFKSKSHGIYRDIPLVNDVKREDGSSNRIVARVENLDCGDEEYESSREGNNLHVRLGDEDVEITGKYEYNISYNYVMGNDVLPNEDEFYFNVIGTGWETTISNVSFSIEMPETFDENNLGMSYGAYGESKLDGLYYSIDGNTIYGELDASVVLGAGEGVNVRLSLPEGYFIKVKHTPWMAYVGIVFAALAVIVAFLLWFIFGRDDPVIETVEFYPPDGLNSVELAFAYRGYASSKDVVSMIVDLAQKGYIEIHQGPNKKDFTLIKRLEYNGTNKAEKLFMDGLFSSFDRVDKIDLEDSFYKTINSIKSEVNSRENKEKLFYANSINKGWILWMLSILACLFAGFYPVKNYEYSTIFGLLVPLGIGVAVMLGSFFLFRKGKILPRIGIFLGLLAGAAVAYYFFMNSAMQCVDPLYRISYFIALGASFVAMFFHDFLSKRTPYGTEILGRILGFRNFLITAEKDKLEALVEENPEYFYDILPYTYVLDVSSKWMNKFESLTMSAPSWYSSEDDRAFDYIMFSHFMSSTMSTAMTSMTSTPSSSSGGGFSGGGSGGGGGGSW